MEKSGEAREAPVTRPWRDLSWRGIRLLVLAAFAAPIARRAPPESARNARVRPHDRPRAKKGVGTHLRAMETLLPYNLVNGSPRACCGAGTLRWQNALRHRSALR